MPMDCKDKQMTAGAVAVGLGTVATLLSPKITVNKRKVFQGKNSTLKKGALLVGTALLGWYATGHFMSDNTCDATAFDYLKSDKKTT